MKIGKLPNEVLEKLVFANIKNKREEVITRAGVGEDCAVIDFGEYGCVVSTDPITGATYNIGKLAVHISCNDVASNGAEPIGLLMTIMAPADTTEEDIERIMQEAGEAAKDLNVEIVGGHTEITDAVNRTVISTTVIGRQPKKRILSSDDIKIGDKILITKTAAIEGTAILARELEDHLRKEITQESLNEGKDLINYISVVKEGLICSEIGVNYMHDITEGGVLGALWEASVAIGKGVLVDKESIPVAKVTEQICRQLDIDPLRLISSGSMLVICDQEKVQEIINNLKEERILATVVGEVTEGEQKININGDILDLTPPESDELYKVL